MNTTRYLVTGGAGFIGSHLVERLLADGHSVTVLDDLSTGSLANLAAVSDHPRLGVERGSVLDRERVRALVAAAERVVHLAAVVGVRRVLERPLETLETNVDGTRRVLEAAAEGGTPVLLASSSEVYGDGQGGPSSELDPLRLGPTDRARWTYAGSKALDELWATAYRADRGLPVDVVRFFNVVGPRQVDRYGMALPTFVGQALRGEPLTVHGDGRQRRSFCHVADAVEALARLLARDPAGGLLVNVGSDREIEIGALAELVRLATGTRAPVVHVAYAEAYGEHFADVRRRLPDLERLVATTGWRPAIPLERTIADVIEDRRRALEARV